MSAVHYQLPQELVGAYRHFSEALAQRYGLTISTLRYTRLCFEASQLPGNPAQGGRRWVEVRIDGQLVRCLYDPKGVGVLVTCFWKQPEIPRPGRQRVDTWTSPDGHVKRKYKDGTKKAKGFKPKRYKRPAPGQELD